MKENGVKRKSGVSPFMVYFIHHCSQASIMDMNIEIKHASRSKLGCKSTLLHENMIVRGIDSILFHTCKRIYAVNYFVSENKKENFYAVKN